MNVRVEANMTVFVQFIGTHTGHGTGPEEMKHSSLPATVKEDEEGCCRMTPRADFVMKAC